MAFSSVQDLIDAEAKRRAMRDAEMRQGFQSSAAQLADAAGLAYNVDKEQKAEALRLRKQDAAEAQQKVENERNAASDAREVEALRLKTLADDRAAGAHAQAMADAQAQSERTAAEAARKQAIEAIGLIDPTKLPDDMDPTALIDAAGAKAGLSPAESRQLHREIWSQKSAAEDARKLSDAKAQSEIDARKASTAQGWRALRIQQQKADAAAKADEPGSNFAPTPVVISDLQKRRQDIGKMKAAADSIRDLIQKYDVEEYVGPLDQIGGYIANKAGLRGEQAAAVESTIRRAFDAYRVAVTGAAAGVKEMEGMVQTVPNMGDRLPAILGKLSADEGIAQRQLQAIDAQLSANDVRAGTASNPTPAPTPAATIQTADEFFGG